MTALADPAPLWQGELCGTALNVAHRILLTGTASQAAASLGKESIVLSLREQWTWVTCRASTWL